MQNLKPTHFSAVAEALLDRARVIGEAQVDLNRVRARRNALVSQLLADPEYQPLSAYKIQARQNAIG